MTEGWPSLGLGWVELFDMCLGKDATPTAGKLSRAVT